MMEDDGSRGSIIYFSIRDEIAVMLRSMTHDDQCSWMMCIYRVCDIPDVETMIKFEWNPVWLSISPKAVHGPSTHR